MAYQDLGKCAGVFVLLFSPLLCRDLPFGKTTSPRFWTDGSTTGVDRALAERPSRSWQRSIICLRTCDCSCLYDPTE
jgi:hypothetical protein